MKKLVFISWTIVTFLLVACNSDKTASGGGMSDKAKKNLDASRAIAKMFESDDWSKTGDYIAADATDHAGMHGDIKGLDSIKANFDMMGKMMGNFKNDVVREWADDEYAVQWLKETATMKVDDPMMGKAGTTTTINAIEVSKFNSDGKVTEHWAFVDWADAMKMMTPPAGGNMEMAMPKKDSAGKAEKK